MSNRFPAQFNELVGLRDVMDRFVNDEFSSTRSPWATVWGSSAGQTALPLDVYATSDEITVIAAAPGLTPDDIEITINDNTVVLKGNLPNVAVSNEAKSATWYLHELTHGAFQRSITLPVEIDAARVDASFENGILKLRLPKAEAAKPRQIKVRVNNSQASNGAGSAPEAIESGDGDTDAEANE